MSLRAITSASANVGSSVPAVAKPSGTTSGDTLLLVVSQDTTLSTISPPGGAGFAAFASSPLQSTWDAQTLAGWWKVAGGSEPSTYTPTSTTTNESVVVCAAYSGRDGVAPLEASSGNSSSTGQSTAATVTGSTITTTSDGCDIVLVASTDLDVAGTETWTQPGGFSSQGTFPGPRAFFSVFVADSNQPTHGATGSVSASDSFTNGGKTGFAAFLLALKPAGGGAPQLEDPSRRVAAQVAAMRQPSAIPQAIQAGLALFVTGAQGPTVPQGDPAASAASQAIMAYRGPTNIVAQPAPDSVVTTALAAVTGPTVPMGSRGAAQALAAYRDAARLPQAPGQIVTQGGAAPAAYLPPSVVAMPVPPVPWPYAAIQAAEPTASQFGIADADLIFDRLKPDIVEQQPWVYGQVAAAAAAPEIAAVIPAPAAAVPPAPMALPQQRDWPYHEFAVPDTAGVAAPLFGTTQAYLGGPPVRLPPPQAWPYASAVAIEFGPAAMTFVAPLPPTFTPTLLPVEQFWPHALLQPRPTQFIGITPVQIIAPPVAVPQPSAWPYVLTMQPAELAPLLPAPAVQLAGPNVMPVQVPAWAYSAVMPSAAVAPLAPAPAAAVPPTAAQQQPAATPWPYALARPWPQGLTGPAPVIGPQLPPNPVLQWMVQPPWPYAWLQGRPLTTAGGISAFGYGNTFVERVAPRQRAARIQEKHIMSLTKRTWEERLIDFDGSAELPAGVTITTIAQIVSDPAGLTFANPVINGAPVTYPYGTAPAGTVVQATIKGGANGADYMARAQCVDSNAEKVELTVRIKVRDQVS